MTSNHPFFVAIALKLGIAQKPQSTSWLATCAPSMHSLCWSCHCIAPKFQVFATAVAGATPRAYAGMCSACRTARGEHNASQTLLHAGSIHVSTQAQFERKWTLLNLLRSRDLMLRSDSRPCTSFIISGVGNARAIATTMKEMSWYFGYTSYESSRMVYEDTDSECDYNYDSDDSWGGGGYRYRRGGYYVDSEGGKEIALANWVRNRTRTAVFCSSSEDPDTNARPPSSLWDRIDGLMLDKWGWARLKIKTRALLRTVGGGGVNEAAGAGAAVGAEGTAGDVVATAPAPPASARPLIKKLTTSPTTSFSKLPATVLSSLVKLVLFSDPAPAPGVLESSDDQDACLHRILARKVEREADAKVVGEKIGAAVAKARKAAKGGGSMENN